MSFKPPLGGDERDALNSLHEATAGASSKLAALHTIDLVAPLAGSAIDLAYCGDVRPVPLRRCS